MNVLHINQSDIAGGAAIAGFRLHQGLLARGVDSRLLVGTVQTESDRVALVPRKPRLERQLNRLTYRLGLNYLNIVGSFDIPRHPFYRAADVVNFNNLHNGYFNYLTLPQLTAKPAVYTLHDMWSFTGHCAYSYDCNGWQTRCGRCPYPETIPYIARDNTRIEWHLKQWVYRHSRLTIVAPSRWLVEQAQQSMLNRFPIHHIPYGIDTTVYQPLDPARCRQQLGIPADRTVLMFGAASLSDPRKGGDLLVKALQQLPPSYKDRIQLVTMGGSSDGFADTLGMPIVNLGYITGDAEKAIAYSAADLFLFPTRADNLPLVLQESMACGTPMVSFKVGGVPDLVRPGETGYLAMPEDTADFCQGIVQLLDQPQHLNAMRHHCRRIAVEEYAIAQQVERYCQLYQSLLAQEVAS